MLETISSWLKGRGKSLRALDRRRGPLYGFDRYPCPCCGLPTIDEPGIYDICAVCWWEDDGQEGESPYSPNRCSLARARENFAAGLTMFDAGAEPEGFADSEQQRERKRRLLTAYELLRSDTDTGSQDRLRHEIRSLISEISRER